MLYIYIYYVYVDLYICTPYIYILCIRRLIYICTPPNSAHSFLKGGGPYHGPKNGVMNLDAGLLIHNFLARSLATLSRPHDTNRSAQYGQQRQIHWYGSIHQRKLAPFPMTNLVILKRRRRRRPSSTKNCCLELPRRG